LELVKKNRKSYLIKRSLFPSVIFLENRKELSRVLLLLVIEGCEKIRREE